MRQAKSNIPVIDRNTFGSARQDASTAFSRCVGVVILNRRKVSHCRVAGRSQQLTISVESVGRSRNRPFFRPARSLAPRLVFPPGL